LRNGRAWASPRHPARRQDWYLLAYGHDYKAALRDAARIFGAQPLPPRFTLGYWWSRYWAYTDREIEELVNNFNTMKVPIDVMVVDMDWHLEGWTGYTWDKRYFPDPDDFLRWLKSQDLKITLNLHPASGVGKHEEQFKKMAAELGIDPDSVERIRFDCTDPKYMDAYFKHLHQPHEDAGVDFWWIDWQQGSKSKIEGLDPLPWLNILHWQDIENRRKSLRPLILSRFGGIGAGRYPLGFSGDTDSLWETLAFQPYFTSTASNILFGYWTHDIGGHAPGCAIPSELYTRWVQFGVYSPIIRTHTTKNPEAERRIWAYPPPYSEIMMNAIRHRYEMVPYTYTENRKCYDTAISLCRPMYYDNPESDAAYKAQSQYMFGDEMLVAPVIAPVDAADEMAEVKVWLPEGTWFDTAVGLIDKGGHIIKRRYNIYEVPVFVRSGAIIPGQQAPLRLRPGCYRDLMVTVYPGVRGSYTLYEDDGVSRDYGRGGFAEIPLSHEEVKGVRRITIGKARGAYNGFEPKRSLEIRLAASIPPVSVKANGKRLKWAYRLGRSGWAYDGDNATTIIRVPVFDITKGLTVEVARDASVPASAALGLKGLASRLRATKEYSAAHILERVIVEAAQTGNRISRKPSAFLGEVRKLGSIMNQLPAALRLTPKTGQIPLKKVETAISIINTTVNEFKHVLI
jgi:alpha-glucosidase